MRLAFGFIICAMALRPAASAGQDLPSLGALLQAAGLTLPALPAEGAAPRTFRLLWQASQGEAGDTSGFLEAESARAAGGRFTLSEVRPAAGPPARRRQPRPSPGQLLAVAASPAGEVQSWELISDPRLLRAELPDAQGELRHRTFFRSRAEFSVTLSAAPETAEIRLYEPRWDGETLTLEPLATLVPR